MFTGYESYTDEELARMARDSAQAFAMELGRRLAQANDKGEELNDRIETLLRGGLQR